jgi:hypothetical protein
MPLFDLPTCARPVQPVIAQPSHDHLAEVCAVSTRTEQGELFSEQVALGCIRPERN